MGKRQLTSARFYRGIPVLLLLCALSATAGVYRWVDSQGNVHYSQSVPVEASQSGHAEMTDSGAVVGKVKSRKEREEKIKQEQFKALEKKISEQERYDRLIENIYPNKEAMEDHFGTQISMISTNIRLLEYHRKQLINRISDTKEALAKTRNKADKEKLNRTLEGLESNLKDHGKAIEENRDEQIKISQRMKRALITMNSRARTSRVHDNKRAFNDLLKQYCNCSCDK